MMQDYPKLLSDGAKVGFTVLERKAVREYSPVKNATADAVLKIAAGLEGACAATGEADAYAFDCDLLSVGGMVIGDAIEREFLGVPIALRPAACLTPHFGLTEDDFERCVRGGSLGSGATLVVEGPGAVVLDNVTVKPGAALRVTTGEGTNLVIKDLVVENRGNAFVALTEAELADESVPEATRIRGFRVEKREETHLVFELPGDFTA
jgi:UDP-sugar pyrophosphorylase